MLKGEYHFLQGLCPFINAASRYLVEVNLTTLAMWAAALQDSIFANVSSAAQAVIGTCAGQKLGPAVFAKIVVVCTNASATVDTDGGPEEMI